ncbi:MAG: hypothetical protein AUG44_08485 [Actinobacteria bacterium 13_1_20CM_3_71_11]|nr:MAG: hypothetical protein AUG44_08485 [Actinobacteria bacterium 13_1_20CM_3_71_11]
MLTLPELIAADPDRTARTAQEWHRLARTVGGHAAELDRQLAALRARWTGTAAEAATAHLSALCTELDRATPALYAIEQALTEHAATVARAQDIAVSAGAYAGCYRVSVGADGTTTLDRTGERPDAGDVSAAERLTAELHHALALAEGSDAATAARLASSGPVTPDEASGPPPDRDPVHVAAWWHGLSPAQRRTLLDRHPELVGDLDGVPATDRDVANRVRLARLLADPGTPHRAGLLAIGARLDAAGPDRAYLLGLSTDGSGRAIVALGDPDTADNVVTSVPGLGGRLDHVADELARIDHLSAAARHTAPHESTSVIAWLGYDAPDTLVQAADKGRAVGAESALHRFQAGLRATHRGSASHNTVIGLSYGSTVVGFTGHALGLAADDVVLIGSPGVGVAHATDLGLNPAHVWASTARHDVINAAASPVQPGLPPLLRPLFGEHTEHLWYGPSPAGYAFGAHVFSSAPGRATDPVGTHTAYFDPGNPALTNMADIAVGDLAEVS